MVHELAKLFLTVQVCKHCIKLQVHMSSVNAGIEELQARIQKIF
jgi:hypothetical protein